jgi:dihydroxyacetone kinase-like protein
MCAAVEEKQDWLSKLDAACGDGDHGVSMARGFGAVRGKLPSWGGQCPGVLLRNVGMTLVSAVGGATGPLLGTLFIEAGKVAGESLALDTQTLAAMFRAGLDGLCRRGGAQPGDKTMVDALLPAVEALQQAGAEEASPQEALARAADAAQDGAEGTVSMLARQGKARYLGKRAIGHADAGAHSIALMMRALSDGARDGYERNPNGREDSINGDEEADQ